MADINPSFLLTADSIIARLERAPLSIWQVKLRLIVGTATFFNAFEVLAIAYALPQLSADWHLTKAQSGLLLSSLFMGEIAGALIFGIIAEYYGRRVALIGCTAIYSCMSLAASLAPDFTWLVTARVLTGLGLGAEVPIAVTYISEIAKAEGRGRFVLLYEMVFPLGLLAAGLLGWWFILHMGWRPLLAIGALPALLVLPMQHLLPESPRWLVDQGRLDEADAVVRRIEASGKLPGEPHLPTGRRLHRPKAQTFLSRTTVGSAARGLSLVARLFDANYSRRTATLWTMYFICFFMNYGLVTWLPSLYRSMFHLSLADSLRNAMIVQVAGLAGTLTAALAIEMVERRVWFATAFLLAALAFLNLALNGLSSASGMLIDSCIGYYFVSTISISMILYAPELYPTRMRVVGVSSGYSISILAGIVAPLFVGMVVDGAGLAGIFVLFAGLGGIASATCLLFAIETRNRTLEAISP